MNSFRLICRRYAPKRLSIGDQRRDFFDSCLLWLKSWLHGLPTELKPVQSGTPNQFPQAYTLCMVYHTAIILLARPYIQSQTPASSAPDPLVEKATASFLEAARNISFLGDQYRQVFGSFRRSPITATHANLSAALALLNPQNQCTARLNQSDNANIKSCIQTLKELSTAWTPPAKFHCNILKMIQDIADQQGMATTSDALTDHHDGGSNPTSRGTHLIPPGNGAWFGPSIEEVGWPSYMSTIGDETSVEQFSATTESLPF